MGTFDHQAFGLQNDKSLVYTAISKHFFYFKGFVSKFVIEQGKVPLNPFMIFDYFLLDTVDRNLVIEGNNNLVKRSDELWVFGPIADGVLAEIKMAKGKKPIRYFKILNSKDIVEITPQEAEFEDKVKEFRDEIL